MADKGEPLRGEPLKVHPETIEAWESWLEANHQKERVAWLVFKKKGTGKAPFDYQMALDVALCFGWVDSLLKTIDEQHYMRKFTPRKPKSTWSEINKRKVELLTHQGRMKPAGLLTIEVAKENGMWDRGIKIPQVDDTLPGALLSAFQNHPEARDYYFNLNLPEQKQYNIWINMAKRAETIHRRVEESVRLLEKGERLGLK